VHADEVLTAFLELESNCSQDIEGSKTRPYKQIRLYLT